MIAVVKTTTVNDFISSKIELVILGRKKMNALKINANAFKYFIAIGMVIACLTTMPKAYAETVVNDNLIVKGTTCVGAQCADGEFFDFATLMLKQETIRIVIDDTSPKAQGSHQDWRIIINDKNSDGKNRFVIEKINKENEGNGIPLLEISENGDLSIKGNLQTTSCPIIKKD